MSRKRRRRPRADPALIAQLDVVYAEMPTVACKGLCQESCGPIVQARSTAEQELLRMQDAGGEKRGRQQRRPLSCPYLTAEDETGRCSIYESRPAICRLWGIVDVPLMRCTHGCEATEMLSGRAGAMVLAFVMTIGGMLTPDPTYARVAGKLIGTSLDAQQRITIGRLSDDD